MYTFINISLHHIATPTPHQKQLIRSTNTINNKITKNTHTKKTIRVPGPYQPRTNTWPSFIVFNPQPANPIPSCASPRHPLVSPHNSVSCNSAVQSHGNPPETSRRPKGGEKNVVKRVVGGCCNTLNHKILSSSTNCWSAGELVGSPQGCSSLLTGLGPARQNEDCPRCWQRPHCQVLEGANGPGACLNAETDRHGGPPRHLQHGSQKTFRFI